MHLQLDELEILKETSDELLKACSIKAGQVNRIKNSLCDLESVSPVESEIHPNEVIIVQKDDDLTEVQHLAFDIEVMPAEAAEIYNPIDESPAKSIETNTSPLAAFTTETFTPDDQWLSSFELPTKVQYILF